MKHLTGALNSFVFAVGLSALGKKINYNALFSTVAGSGFLVEEVGF